MLLNLFKSRRRKPGYGVTMNFDTNITPPRSDAAFGRDASVARTHGSDAGAKLRPHFVVQGAALIMLPVYLPVMMMWTLWHVMNRVAGRLLSGGAVFDEDSPLPANPDDYIFNPSDLYSGLCLSIGESRPELAQISALVYLYRPDSLRRPLQALMSRQTILAEFIARVSGNRVALFGLAPKPCGRCDMDLSVMATLFGERRCFALSTGLSPEPPVPE